MVLSSRMVVTVANVSAHLCQYVACNPEILPTEEVLRLIFCLPLQQIRRISLCLAAVFCFPSLRSNFPFLYSSSSSTSSDDDDGDYDRDSSSGYASHSD